MRRRDVLAATGLGAVMVGARALPAAAQASEPKAFVQGVADRMTGIIDSSGSKTSKAAALQATVDQSVDSDEIARFCLGRFWRSATPQQQSAYIAMFHQVLLDGITGQISAYQGVRVATGPARDREDGTIVPSVVSRPGQKEVRVDWLVRATPAGLRIADVIAEGTSLRMTRRNDYSAFLGSHEGDVAALLGAMKRRLEQA